MKLRTKLVLAFFFLAVVPLVTIVLYTYSSSIDAFRSAVEAETWELAEDMNERMAAVRDDLDGFLGRATELRLASLELGEGELPAHGPEFAKLRQEALEFGPMVEACEFIPAPPIEPCQDVTPAVRPEAPTAGIEIPRHVVLLSDWLQIEIEETDTGGEGTTNVEISTEWLTELVEGGAELLAELEENPEAIDDYLDEHGDEIASKVMGVVAEQGPKIIAKAIEDPEAFAEVINLQGVELKKHLLEAIPTAMRLTGEELRRLEEERARSEELLGRQYAYEIREGDHLIGHMHAQVNASHVLEAVLQETRRDEGEVPFAVDGNGTVHALTPEDESVLEELRVARSGDGDAALEDKDWIVVETEEPVSGTAFGIARPVGKGLEEIRRTAVRNMAFGMFLVAVAGCGFVPLSRRMTRNLTSLTAAAKALARGELDTRVHIRSRDEIGQLAKAFNHMAADLDENQTRLLEQQRMQREQEMETRLLEVENQRKSEDLEQARHFQLSLLPDRVPQHPQYEIAVTMRTATEVGGDYYDFREDQDGSLVVALGDATGHGAAAGTMVTAAKSLFTAAGDLSPAPFLNRAAKVIRTMRLGRMSMALAVIRLEPDGLVVSMAGMPPLLVRHFGGTEVEEVVVPGVPLGSFRAPDYRQVRVPLVAGDTVLLMSDGFPELLDPAGEPLGYERARALFNNAAGEAPEKLIESLDAAASQWRDERAQTDDITFLALRMR